MIFYLVPAIQAHGMQQYLDDWGRPVADRLRILPYEELPDRTLFGAGTYILSGLDQLGPPMLRLVSEVRRTLSPVSGFRFLNEPGVTLGRFDLLTRLHRRGLNRFRAIRADADLGTLRFPVFLRADRTHDGAVSPLLHTEREVEAALGRALLRGRRVSDLIVVEFSDTAFADGRYRKYNAYFVGDRIVPRGLAVGQDWMLKENRGVRDEATSTEELEFVAGNPHAAQLAEIRAVAGAEYGRIDYGIRDGRVETWEINLNPRIGVGRDHKSKRVYSQVTKEIRTRSKEIFYRDFQAALKALDLPRGDEAPLVIDEEIRRAALSDPGVRLPPSDGGPARFLEPARPVLETLVGGLLPWLGRVARRRSRPLSGH